IEEPDKTLMAWMEHEERLFRRMERYLVADRLQKGFVDNEEIDIDGFLSFSLSVQNRRKSRAGYAFENHLEAIFQMNSIRYSVREETENKTKPDFIFPDIHLYRKAKFPAGM